MKNALILACLIVFAITGCNTEDTTSKKTKNLPTKPTWTKKQEDSIRLVDRVVRKSNAWKSIIDDIEEGYYHDSTSFEHFLGQCNYHRSISPYLIKKYTNLLNELPVSYNYEFLNGYITPTEHKNVHHLHLEAVAKNQLTYKIIMTWNSAKIIDHKIFKTTNCPICLPNEVLLDWSSSSWGNDTIILRYAPRPEPLRKLLVKDHIREDLWVVDSLGKINFVSSRPYSFEAEKKALKK